MAAAPAALAWRFGTPQGATRRKISSGAVQHRGLDWIGLDWTGLDWVHVGLGWLPMPFWVQ